MLNFSVNVNFTTGSLLVSQSLLLNVICAVSTVDFFHTFQECIFCDCKSVPLFAFCKSVHLFAFTLFSHFAFTVALLLF